MILIPVIDKKATGVNIRRTMDKHDFSVKDLQAYLGLNSLQSIYHWLNGICLPTIDNLYALSSLFQTPLDDLICGSRPPVTEQPFYSVPSFRTLQNHHSHVIWWQRIPLSDLGLHRAMPYRKITV